MQVAVFGINLESSQISVREKLLKKIKSYLPHYNVIPLMTCNRFEVYISSSQYNFLRRVFYDFLKPDIDEELFKKSYLYFSYDCFGHLCKTTAGLNSAILGESEIQHQVKIAYLNAAKKKLPFSLHFLFQKALKIGKQIRTNFSFRDHSFSLSSFIYAEIHPVYENPSVLFVGKSRLNQSIRKFFLRKKINNITIASRYLEPEDTPCLTFSELYKWFKYDVVICATNISKKCIRPIKSNKKRFLFDLSSPSIVDLNVAENNDIIFWSLQKINTFFSAKKNHHMEAINECLKEIEHQIATQKAIFEKKECNRLIFQKRAS